MTPKEKAIELIEKFESLVPSKYYVLEFGGNDNNYRDITIESKQCSIISINEILNSLDYDFINYYKNFSFREYWLNVKEEINNYKNDKL